MKITALPSLGTRRPTMFCLSVMTNKEIKKIQGRAYTWKRYKHVRKALKVIEEKELGIKLT